VTATMRDWQDSLRGGDPGTARLSPPETVIVLLDGSEESRAALPVAKHFAELQRATLHVVSTGEPQAEARYVLDQLRLTPEDVRGAVLDRLQQAPDEAVLNVAQTCPAPLITLSTHAIGEDTQAIVGQLAENVLTKAPAQKAPAQLLLVAPDRGRHPWVIRRIVLAHDGSPTADAAIAPTADLAKRAGADVIALHVAARKASQDVEPGSLPAPRYLDQPQHEWPSWASEFVQRMMALGASPAAVNFKLLVTGGQPGSEIAQFARDNNADLVVATWRGQWDPEHAGTLKVLVRRSGCPVLLITGAQQNP